MSDSIKAIVALETTADSSAVVEWLTASSVQILGLVEGLEDGASAVSGSDGDLLVVACTGYSEPALHFIAEASRQSPTCPVVVLCEDSANGFVRRVFEAGADDIVTIPENVSSEEADALAEQMRFTFQKAVARMARTTASGGPQSGELICVLGPKGGVGKTLTASNLAVSLADAGQRVALVDLDLQFGDIGLALGLPPDKTIFDLAASSGSLDSEKLEAYLVPHASGVRALLAPVRPDQAGAVRVEFLRDVFTLLRSTSDHVIVDTPPGFTPEVIASVDSSSHVCMLATIDSVSLKTTRLGLEALELMGYSSDRIRLVLNRADARVGVTAEDVVAVLRREPDLLVPSHRDVARSLNEGSPIALADRRSDAAKAFRALAEVFAPVESLVESAKQNGRRLALRRRG